MVTKLIKARKNPEENILGANITSNPSVIFPSVSNPLRFPVDNAKDIDALLKSASNTSLDFTPSHILVPVDSTFKDMLGNWDLTSTGGDATKTDHAIKSVRNSTNAWVASANSKYQFGTSNFAFLMITRFSAKGSGGYFISNLKGPDATDPYAPGGPFGQDKGYGLSMNADGGMGFGIYGAGGYTNADTANGTIDHSDNVWRAYAWGYSQDSSIAYLSSSSYNIAFAGAIGNTSNTDAIFGTRCDYYGASQSNADHETALLCVFIGDAAQNIYLQRSNFLSNVQKLIGS